ncbi:DNA methyltransferase [Sneathia sanguinegens]|uniref:DNA methyltransferase n=1 Tax=Sneathia sanguinegens TaxID=40543 RepID=UPI001E579DB6|nr:DNA methyltransferase [Sneathia sanguinegens]
MDDNEQAQLKLLCDEIFGGENFIASITRNTNSSKNQSLYISVSHEYCLVYSKNIYKWNNAR